MKSTNPNLGSLENTQAENSHGYDVGKDNLRKVNVTEDDHIDNKDEENIQEDNESEVGHKYDACKEDLHKEIEIYNNKNKKIQWNGTKITMSVITSVV